MLNKDGAIVPWRGVHLERRVEACVVEGSRDAVAEDVDGLKKQNQRFGLRSVVRDVSKVHERKL